MLGKREKTLFGGVRARLGFGVRIGRNGGWALRVGVVGFMGGGGGGGGAPGSN
jgi:hypothetical protein